MAPLLSTTNAHYHSSPLLVMMMPHRHLSFHLNPPAHLSLPNFSSSFLPLTALRRRLLALQLLHCRTRRYRHSRIRAVELDQDTVVAIGVGVAGIALGIGIPVFYEMQAKASANRENDQPCFPCKGTGAQTCRFCLGAGNISVELGGGEKEVSKCINCEGAGSITCTTCQGTGVQPRYLDRREFKDDD